MQNRVQYRVHYIDVKVVRAAMKRLTEEKTKRNKHEKKGGREVVGSRNRCIGQGKQYKRFMGRGDPFPIERKTNEIHTGELAFAK